MARKIDLMETGISLARLFRLALKNYQVIISSFILGLFLAFLYTTSPLMDSGTYQGTGAVNYRVSTNATVLNTVVEVIKSQAVADEAAMILEGDLEAELPTVTLANGDPITASIIQSTLTATTATNSLRITITFTHPEEAIVTPIINAVIDASILIGNRDYPVINNNMVLGEYATAITFDGPSTTLYLAIGALLGLMIGGAVGVLWDAFKGTIYSAQDLKEFGLSSFLVPLNVKLPFHIKTILRWLGLGEKSLYEKKQTKLIQSGLVPSPAFTTIQNNLESTRPQPEDPLTTLLVTPLPSGSTLMMVAFAYARQSSTQGRKTLLIDFDLKDVPFTQYLDRHKIQTKKKPSTKDGVTFLSLEDNLDLHLPAQDILPAKVIRDEATQDLIAKVKKKYDHIIILGPSVLPDASILSMVSYANSALIVGHTGEVTTTEVIKTVNTLIDANLSTIETMIVSEDIQTKWPSWEDLKSLFAPITKVKRESKQKPSKKK